MVSRGRGWTTGLREDAPATGLRGDAGVVARAGVVQRLGTLRRLRRVELVVAVDDRRQAGGRVGGDAEVVEEVAVARAGNAALAGAAEVVDRRGRDLCELAARLVGLQVLREVDVPGGGAGVVVGRVDAVEIRRAVVDDIQ